MEFFFAFLSLLSEFRSIRPKLDPPDAFILYRFPWARTFALNWINNKKLRSGARELEERMFCRALVLCVSIICVYAQIGFNLQAITVHFPSLFELASNLPFRFQELLIWWKMEKFKLHMTPKIIGSLRASPLALLKHQHFLGGRPTTSYSTNLPSKFLNIIIITLLRETDLSSQPLEMRIRQRLLKGKWDMLQYFWLTISSSGSITSTQALLEIPVLCSSDCNGLPFYYLSNISNVYKRCTWYCARVFHFWCSEQLPVRSLHFKAVRHIR